MASKFDVIKSGQNGVIEDYLKDWMPLSREISEIIDFDDMNSKSNRASDFLVLFFDVF